MAITVTQQDAQFQAGVGGAVLHSITSPSHTWTTGDQLLFCVPWQHNALPDRDLASLTASAGTLSTPILGNASQYTGASYKLDGSVAFSTFTAGATATLTATDNTTDGADMWLTGSVLKLTGVDTTTPIRQSAIAGTAAGGGNSVAVTLGSVPLTDSALVAICIANNNNAWSLPSSPLTWDAITGLAETTWGGYHATTWKVGNSGSTGPYTFPNAGNTSGLAVVVYEIAAAAGGSVAVNHLTPQLGRRRI